MIDDNYDSDDAFQTDLLPSPSPSAGAKQNSGLPQLGGNLFKVAPPSRKSNKNQADSVTGRAGYRSSKGFASGTDDKGI